MNKDLDNLIKQYCVKHKYSYEDDLEFDMGVTGDDALDLMTKYKDMFNVDVSQFKILDYFHDEFEFIPFVLKKWFRQYNKKKLSPNDLLKGIELGKLIGGLE